LDVQHHMLWGFIGVQWVQLRCDGVVNCVDIDGIDDRCCLTFCS
jgi:hypothetical protein